MSITSLLSSSPSISTSTSSPTPTTTNSTTTTEDSHDHPYYHNGLLKRRSIATKANNTNRYKEFLCGWASGCVETCILYPANKLIFRQLLHNFKAHQAFHMLHREGVSLLYRGVLPPLLQRTTTRSIMFGGFETYQKLLHCATGRSSCTLCHAAAAFLAGTTEAILCPLERTQVLLQHSDYHGRFRNTFEAFQTILRQNGLLEFYRGFSMVVLRNGSSNVLFFTLREPFREGVFQTFSFIRHQFSSNSTPYLMPVEEACRPPAETIAANFISGAVLGACISTFFFPFGVVKSRIQSVLGGHFQSPGSVFLLVLRERNGKFQSLFRGAHLNFMRSLLTWGITNTVYELLMRELFGGGGAGGENVV